MLARAAPVLARAAAPSGRVLATRAPLAAQALPMLPQTAFKSLPLVKPYVYDEVRYAYVYMAIWAAGTAFIVMGLFYTPFEGAGYDHLFKSPYYKWVEASMAASGALQENVRVKQTSFYKEQEE